MIKFYSAILVVMCANLYVGAQNATTAPNVVSSGGDHFQPTPADASVSWTVGEPTISTLDNGQLLTQGFHQTSLSVLMIANSPATAWSLEVFPNPTSDLLQIRALHSPAPDFLISLTDVSGKVVINSNMATEQCQLNLTHLAVGSYHLKVADATTNAFKTFKIVKSK